MPLSTFLRDPENWLGHAHSPVIFPQINDFMVGIGASKHITQPTAALHPPAEDDLLYTNWHAPGYKGKNFRPLLHLSDDEPRTLANHLGGVNLLISQEYNPVLHISGATETFLDDLPWLGKVADAITAFGYPEHTVGELISLLRVEGDYGRSQVHYGSHRLMRPDVMLLDNIHYAELVIAAEHLKPADRRRYMRLDIPLNVLPSLLAPSMPYAYVKSLYRRRTEYQAGG